MCPGCGGVYGHTKFCSVPERERAYSQGRRDALAESKDAEIASLKRQVERLKDALRLLGRAQQ